MRIAVRSAAVIACLLILSGCAISARYDRKRVFLVTLGPTLFYSSDVEAEAKSNPAVEKEKTFVSCEDDE